MAGGLGHKDLIDRCRPIFRTGYSSLQYLQRFPIDVLKIPKPFVDELANCGGAGTLAAVILDLSRRFGLGTIAEGIETEEQAGEAGGARLSLGSGLPRGQADADRGAAPVPGGEELSR
jgi:predicted signal transduction protein with EAL and GGDEF domain